MNANGTTGTTVSPVIAIRRIVRSVNQGDMTPAAARQAAEGIARNSGDLTIATPAYRAATAMEQRDRTNIDH